MKRFIPHRLGIVLEDGDRLNFVCLLELLCLRFLSLIQQLSILWSISLGLNGLLLNKLQKLLSLQYGLRYLLLKSLSLWFLLLLGFLLIWLIYPFCPLPWWVCGSLIWRRIKATHLLNIRFVVSINLIHQNRNQYKSTFFLTIIQSTIVIFSSQYNKLSVRKSKIF